ncbi:MAG: transcriptional regulator NrdR [Firmicutes bacterium]|jgi:transcriptional repressor NrdR|nr:transcriptional regulator NrdR [Bacillota bacterium]
MKCPYCDYHESKVIDSRPTDEGQSIRRRRECIECKKRFTTYEKVEEVPILIIKKNGSRERFTASKLVKGLIKACEKRPVSLSEIEEAVDSIEKKLHSTMEKEISSDYVGYLVMEKLKEIDEVAYVRFASVYRQFKDLETFEEEIKKIRDEKKTVE